MVRVKPRHIRSAFAEACGSMRAHYVSLATSQFPKYILGFAGGIGDQLLLTSVARELTRRAEGPIWIETSMPALFEQNGDIERVLQPSTVLVQVLARLGTIRPDLGYAIHLQDERRAIPPKRHIISEMCAKAGVSGKIHRRPYLFLSSEEQNRTANHSGCIVMQSSGSSAQFPLRTKEWHIDRFQCVATHMSKTHRVVQVGSASDPRLLNTIDLRGKTTIRETAGILSSAVAFVGLIGFLMHLARAVDCPAVIIYGGRETPEQSGYRYNRNLTYQTPWSPCWYYDNCPCKGECMRGITAQDVIDGLDQMLGQKPEVLILDLDEDEI